MSEEEVSSLKKELAVLTERVNNWMATTSDYRISLCSKLDSIKDSLEQRPCSVHEQKLKSIGVLWNIVWFIIPTLLGLSVVWGALQKTIERHDVRLGVLEEIHPRHSLEDSKNGKLQA